MKPAGIKSLARSFVITLMLAAVAVCAPGGGNGNGYGKKKGDNGKVRQVRSVNGSYTIRIVGFYRGTATDATVNDDFVSFKANVTGTDGSVGVFTAENLTIDGPYFSGSGSVNGYSVAIRGRLDAAKASRLVANYRVPNIGNGRIIGTNPDDKGDDKWND